MNISQTKMLIFAIKTIDGLLVAGLIGYLIYGYNQDYSANFIITVGMVGLIIIHQVGQWSITKIAYLRQTLKRMETPPHLR